MVSQEDYTALYKKRLAIIEDDPQFTVLASMNKPMTAGADRVTQYIVYTDFKKDGQKVKTAPSLSTRHSTTSTSTVTPRPTSRRSCCSN